MSMFRSSCAVGLGGALALAILAKGPAAIEARAQFQTTPTLFSGQATVVSGKVLGLPVTLVDTGTVAPEGGKLEAHLICYPNGAANCTLGLPDATNGALGVEVLNATVVAQGHNSHARASVADVTLNAAGQSISATFLQARAAAQCANGQASVQADSEIAELVINGKTIVVSGAVDQRIDLPVVGGFVLINEQTGSGASGSGGDVTVSALHIVIPALVPGSGTETDVVIAKAHADIQCGVKFCPADKDFVTGGGNFANPKRNFAVAGGIKNGGFWGHLLFIDHSTGMKVKGTGVTAYVVTGPTSRHIEGTCDINGSPGRYQADVDDQGEPGVHDVLTLRLNGGAPVAEGVISGGNIQLHTCK